MKKLVIAIAALVLAVGLSLPMVTPAAAQDPLELNPAMELTKNGPEAIFPSVPAEYTYEVKNTGDCSLSVALTDDQTTEISGPEGDDGNGLLDPGEVWTYTAAYLIECTGIAEMEHVNTATAVGTAEDGSIAEATASWTVVVFQWQPRTIGYWGNWENHLTDECMDDLVSSVNAQSAYFGALGLTPEDVHDILLAPEQKGKMNVTKATTLLVKQLLAAWLNVKSYEGATDDDDTTCGSLDAAIRPDAAVHIDGSETTVLELLQSIEANLAADPDVETLLEAKDILDDMNNAEDNGYMMFMPQS